MCVAVVGNGNVSMLNYFEHICVIEPLDDVEAVFTFIYICVGELDEVDLEPWMLCRVE